AICPARLAPRFAAELSLFLPKASGRLEGAADAIADMQQAQWVYLNNQPIGIPTRPWHRSEILYLPLRAPTRVRGVLVLRPGPGKFTGAPDDRQLLDSCCASVALALERVHFANIANATMVRMEGEQLRNALLASISHDLNT